MTSYRPQIYNPTQGQFQRSPAGSFVEADGLVQPAIAQTITATTAIAPVASTIAISSATAIALTATPAIAPGIDLNKFQILTLINVGTYNITLQDEAIFAGSGLRLFKNNWVIRPNQSIALLYRSGKWQQLFGGETLGDADILDAILRVDGDNAGINATTLQGTNGVGFLKTANNLADLSNPSTARTNIGAGTAAWNAFKIQGYNISSVAPTTGQALVFDGTIWSPSAISSEGGCLNQILYRDNNWGTGTQFQASGNWVWRSRDPQTVGDASLGESAIGRIRIGYIKLKNELLLTLLGGGASNGSLKRVRLLKASDATTLIDVGLNSLIGNTDTGVACVINTSSFNEVLAMLELEDADDGSAWAWMGIDLSKHYVSV